MRIVFFGSDDFAAAHLKAIFQSEHTILGCVTPSDKPKGRGMKVRSSPVKDLAIQNHVQLFEPDRLQNPEIVKGLKALNADLFIVIAYGQLLPEEVLKIPSILCANLHASLLPKYRGAAPIAWAIIRGEKETGLSVIEMNPRMDAGRILSQMRLKISCDDTAMTLRNTMMNTGPQFLLETIQKIEEGSCNAHPQDEKAVTFAPKLTKELARIDWQKSADEIRNLIRGLLPWPTAYTFYKGKMLKILSAEIVNGKFDQKIGHVATMDSQGFVVATKDKGLLVKEVHLESSRPMDARNFIRGHQLEVGDKLG